MSGEEIIQCQHCLCMTKTICGKCGEPKVSVLRLPERKTAFKLDNDYEDVNDYVRAKERAEGYNQALDLISKSAQEQGFEVELQRGKE